MAKCKYCNKPTSFLSRSHKECKEKHEKGIQGLKGMLQRYFQGNISALKVGQNIQQNKKPYFLTDDDISQITSETIEEFTRSLHRPYSPYLLSSISELIQNIGISYSKLNHTGVLDRLGQKIMYGYLVDYFAANVSMNQVNKNVSALTNIIPLSTKQKSEIYLSVLNRSAAVFMRNGILTDTEEQQIVSYLQAVGLSINDVIERHGNPDLEKVGQSIVLKNLEKGILPQMTTSVPVLLGKGESALWVYHNITMLQEKFQREYRGQHGGFNIRVFKGVTYRTGQFKGKPIEYSYLNEVGRGSLVVTNKHLYFHCTTASVKIPYSKLIGVTPYSDGLEVHKEEAKPKRIVFQGLDSWFIMNILSCIGSI